MSIEIVLDFNRWHHPISLINLALQMQQPRLLIEVTEFLQEEQKVKTCLALLPEVLTQLKVPEIMSKILKKNHLLVLKLVMEEELQVSVVTMENFVD